MEGFVEKLHDYVKGHEDIFHIPGISGTSTGPGLDNYLAGESFRIRGKETSRSNARFEDMGILRERCRSSRNAFFLYKQDHAGDEKYVNKKDLTPLVSGSKLDRSFAPKLQSRYGWPAGRDVQNDGPVLN